MTVEDKEGFLEQKLPRLPATDSQRYAVKYVNLVYSGMTKEKAYGTVFPDRVANLKNKASERDVSASYMVKADVQKYETGKYVRELYKLTQESYWTMFIDKRTRVLNKMADKALDDDLDFKDQLGAAKVFLSHVPDAQKEDKVIHEVKLSEDTKFIAQLEAKKRQLYAVANEEDIIDVELSDD